MILFIKQLCVFLLTVGGACGFVWFLLWLFSQEWMWMIFFGVLLLMLLLMIWALAGEIVGN